MSFPTPSHVLGSQTRKKTQNYGMKIQNGIEEGPADEKKEEEEEKEDEAAAAAASAMAWVHSGNRRRSGNLL